MMVFLPLRFGQAGGALFWRCGDRGNSGILLPIDHILVSGRWLVEKREVYPDRMGSDHHPVIAVLSMADPEK